MVNRNFSTIIDFITDIEEKVVSFSKFSIFRKLKISGKIFGSTFLGISLFSLVTYMIVVFEKRLLRLSNFAAKYRRANPQILTGQENHVSPVGFRYRAVNETVSPMVSKISAPATSVVYVTDVATSTSSKRIADCVFLAVVRDVIGFYFSWFSA